jgi:hypothetical protein
MNVLTKRNRTGIFVAMFSYLIFFTVGLVVYKFTARAFEESDNFKRLSTINSNNYPGTFPHVPFLKSCMDKKTNIIGFVDPTQSTDNSIGIFANMQKFMNETEKKFFTFQQYASNDEINKFYSSKDGIKPNKRICVGILMTDFDVVNNNYNVSMMYGPYTYYNDQAFRGNLTRA